VVDIDGLNPLDHSLDDISAVMPSQRDTARMMP
jgi:hypothetical protein